MMNIDKYSEEALNGTLTESISKFKKLLKKDCGDVDKYLPKPNKFRYLHEFESYDYAMGGILVVGLNPHGGDRKKKNSNNEEDSSDER